MVQATASHKIAKLTIGASDCVQGLFQAYDSNGPCYTKLKKDSICTIQFI